MWLSDLYRLLSTGNQKLEKIMSILNKVNTEVTALATEVTKVSGDVQTALADLKAQIAALGGSSVTQAEVDTITAGIQTQVDALATLDASLAPPSPPPVA